MDRKLQIDGTALNSQLHERTFVTRYRHPTKRYWMRPEKKFTGDTAKQEAEAWAKKLGGTVIEI